jgi:phage/plasmid-associated DNA primase
MTTSSFTKISADGTSMVYTIANFPSDFSSHDITSFIAQSFIREGTRCFFNKDDSEFSARNTLTLEQFRELNAKGSVELIKSKDKSKYEWKPVKSGDFVSVSLKATGIYCFDLDDSYDWNEIPYWLKLCPFSTSRTKRLQHFYFKMSGIDCDKLNAGFSHKSDNLNFVKGEFLNTAVWELKKDNGGCKDSNRLHGKIYNWNGTIPEIAWNEVKKHLVPSEIKRINDVVGVKESKGFFESKTNDDEESEDETTEEESDSDEETETEKKTPIYNCCENPEIDGYDEDGCWCIKCDAKIPPFYFADKAKAEEKVEKVKKTYKTKEKEPESHSKEEQKQQVANESDNESKMKRLRKIMPLLAPKRMNIWADWLEWTWCIINSFGEEGKTFWAEMNKLYYTRTDKAYDESNNTRIWDIEFKRKKADRKGKTLATIYFWAKTDSPEEYAKMFDKVKIDWQRITPAQFAKHLCSSEFYGDNVIFTGKKASMIGYKYNGVYWEELGLHNAGIKKGVFDKLYDKYMKAFFINIDSFEPEEILGILSSIKRLDDNNFRNNVIECLKTDKYIADIEWNKDRNLWAFNDCVYHLQLGKFVKPDPKQYINWTCGYEYGVTFDDKGKMVWKEYEKEQEECLAFINTLFKHKDDVDYMLTFLASCMKQCNQEEVAHFWLGDGRNGKGTLTKLFNEALGKYFGELNIGFYTTYEKSADAPNNNLFNLRYSRVCNTSEIGENEKQSNAPQKFITSQFKRLTGGDKLVARQPHEKDQIEFVAGKPIIQTNIMPEIVGIELAKNFSLRKRVRIQWFPFRFTDDEEMIEKEPDVYKLGDNTLKEKFENGDLKRGFWRLLTKWYKVYLEKGLVAPQCVKDNTEAYFNASNKVNNWYKEHIVLIDANADGKYNNDINMSDLFAHFCNFNISGTMKKSQFVEYMTNIVGKSSNKSTRGVLTIDNRPHLRGYKIRVNSDENGTGCLLKIQEEEIEYLDA